MIIVQFSELFLSEERLTSLFFNKVIFICFCLCSSHHANATSQLSALWTHILQCLLLSFLGLWLHQYSPFADSSTNHSKLELHRAQPWTSALSYSPFLHFLGFCLLLKHQRLSNVGVLARPLICGKWIWMLQKTKTKSFLPKALNFMGKPRSDMTYEVTAHSSLL